MRPPLIGRRIGIVATLVAVCALGAVGRAYETRQQAIDQTLVPPGRLIDVGGHRLHLRCAGTGSPTVVLESGLGETQSYWDRVVTGVSPDTTVCAYDRAGRGWSEPAPTLQDGASIADDLRVLLERARVPAPYVLVGHSSGAQYVRIFAGRYPDRVAGLVFLDGQPAAAFEGLPTFPVFYAVARRVMALLPGLARLGVGRVLVSTNQALPTTVQEAHRRQHASASYFRSLRDEFAALPVGMAQARRVASIGDRPVAVVTATADPQRGWLALQAELTELSSDSRHRLVPCTHGALVTDQAASRASIEAIRDVVQAVRNRAVVHATW